MDKPENPFRPETISFQLMDGDFSEKSIYQIADELKVGPKSIQKIIYHIKRKTGYCVQYLHLPPIPNEYTKKAKKPFEPFDLTSLSSTKPKSDNKCSTCCNLDCKFLIRRMAICWKNCAFYDEEG